MSSHRVNEVKKLSKEQLNTLLLLQKLDNEIAEEKTVLSRLPEQVEEKERQIADLEKKEQLEKDVLKELQLKIKRREIDAKAINDKIEKHKSELYSGKTSDIKELKQLQKVIELLQVDCDEVEEDLLLLIEEEDSFKLKVSAIEEELTKLQGQLAEIQKQVALEENKVKKFIREKEAEREDIADKINDKVLMDRYLVLWNDKKGEAIVEIEGSICTGCNLSLPSDIIYHLQKDDRLLTCPNSNRILLWKEITKDSIS